jgi:hypothetical protein
MAEYQPILGIVSDNDPDGKSTDPLILKNYNRIRATTLDTGL